MRPPPWTHQNSIERNALLRNYRKAAWAAGQHLLEHWATPGGREGCVAGENRGCFEKTLARFAIYAPWGRYTRVRTTNIQEETMSLDFKVGQVLTKKDVDALKSLVAKAQHVQKALQTARVLLKDHPEVKQGNSTVHYAYHHLTRVAVQSVVGKLTPPTTGAMSLKGRGAAAQAN